MAKIGINISTGSLQKEEMIVGIDLGTTNSLIAVIHPNTGQPTVLKEFDNTALVPSIIYFDPQKQIIVGDDAKQHLVTAPEHTIFSVKRLMGKSYKDVAGDSPFFSYKILDDGSDNLVKVDVDGRFFTPVELSSFILSALKKKGGAYFKNGSS